MKREDVRALPQLALGAGARPRAIRASEVTAEMAELLADDAAHGLSRAMPDLSAHIVITRPQIVALLATLAAALTIAALAPMAAWNALVAFLSFAFVAGTAFRAGLATLGRRSRSDPLGAEDAALPAYTILVPLFREANVLPQLVRALLAIDYPGMLAQTPQEIEPDPA